MKYNWRLFALAVIDSIIVFVSIYFSKWLLFPDADVFVFILIISSATLLISHHVYAYIFRLYKRVWEYASIGELLAILKAVTISIFMTAIVQFIWMGDIYVRMLLVTWMMHILLIGGSRFMWRIYRSTKNKTNARRRTLVIGAGAAGRMVVRQLLYSKEAELLPIAFIDDDPKKQQLYVMGIPIIGTTCEIQELARRHKVEHIVIAIPSLNKQRLRQIVEICTATGIKTQTIPRIEDLILGKVSLNDFRDVQVEDLLGRDPVELDVENISHYISDKVILVTGAGGSIGSELCRQISEFRPTKVVLLGHGENSIYEIHRELNKRYGNSIEYVTEIADIQDKERMLDVMKKHLPEVVFHAAAHKHVPLMECNPAEAIKNNVIGTRNVAMAADEYGVQVFVMISTDKAVNPTSVMGASKRIAEMIIQDMARHSETKFVAVRFGNVLGSRGSVIPLFKEQIRQGGPVTVTHPDMVRYFMTIPEASRLVIQAGALARGGEIFVLDMGEPVKIADLARNLIKLSGFTEEEIRIEYTGIRPGEKLYEEFLNENEVHPKKVFPNIYIGKSVDVDIEEIKCLLDRFVHMKPTEIRETVLEMTNRKVGKQTVSLI